MLRMLTASLFLDDVIEDLELEAQLLLVVDEGLDDVLCSLARR